MHAIKILVVAAILLGSFSTANAVGISRNNPYRTFNISGLNYGSMNWEQQHRGQSTKGSAKPARRFLYR